MYQKHKSRQSTASMKKALLSLMKYKPFSKITATELCRKAKLNRSTFYVNYENLNALLLDLHTDLFHKMAHILDQRAPSFFTDTAAQPSSETLEMRISSVTAIIFCLEENAETFSIFLNNNEDHRFEKHLIRYFLERYADMIHKPADKYILLYHIVGSFSLIQQWLHDGRPYSPEQLAELICSQSHDRFF